MNRTVLLAIISLMLSCAANADLLGEEGVARLYEKAKPVLEHPTPENPFYLKSEFKHRTDSGEAALYFPYAFDALSDALSSAGNWCEILPLHLNVKGCTYGNDGNDLTIYLGRKYYQEPEDAYRLQYRFHITRNEDYFSAVALADEGPLGTSDYHIEVEIIPVGDRSFGRIHVSDHQSWMSSKAMHLYLATKGKEKQGIKVVGHDDRGNPIYSKGEAAVAERNLLRYYFAFAAFLASRDLPAAERHSAALHYWFDQTEKYPQLRELDKSAYLEEKLRERQNQVLLQRSVN